MSTKVVVTTAPEVLEALIDKVGMQKLGTAHRGRCPGLVAAVE